MADPPDRNMAAAWQQFVGQWERQVNDLSATVSGNEAFAAPMNQAGRLSVAARATVDDAREKMAEAMNVASHAQMAAMVERLDRIEERLEQIAALLTPPRPDQRPEPRRTRRPPAA